MEKATALLARHISRMTHPHVPPPRLLLPRCTAQHGRDPTLTLGRVLWMQTVLVTTIRDIDPLVLGQRMGVDGLGRRNAMFPLLLHIGMHDQQRIMREMYTNLALGICQRSIFLAVLVVVLGDNSAHAEFARYP